MNTTNAQPTAQNQWPQQQTLTIQRTIQQPMDQRQIIWSQQSPVNIYCFSKMSLLNYFTDLIIIIICSTDHNK